MPTSSIPAAIDWLVTNIRLLPACAAPVVVEDGWPTRRANKGVVIGIVPGDDTTDDEVTQAQLGAQMEWEEYNIPCLVYATVGGSDTKAARDQAFAIYDAVVGLVRTNPTGRTLGGALNSNFAFIGNVRISQTGVAIEAGEGRTCEIRFSVRAKNRF